MNSENSQIADNLYSLADKYMWSFFVIGFSLMVALAGLRIIKPQIEKNGIGQFNLQALALVLLLPAILVMATNSSVPGEVPATLYGAFAGYVFGTSKSEK